MVASTTSSRKINAFGVDEAVFIIRSRAFTWTVFRAVTLDFVSLVDASLLNNIVGSKNSLVH